MLFFEPGSGGLVVTADDGAEGDWFRVYNLDVNHSRNIIVQASGGGSLGNVASRPNSDSISFKEWTWAGGGWVKTDGCLETWVVP